jgi:hypothetical protein
MAAAAGWSGVEGQGSGGSGKGSLYRAAAVLFLNLLDGLFTLTFLQLSLAEEANPLMRMAYSLSPLAFMISKLAVVHGGVLLLWIHQRWSAARAALQAGVYLYAAIVVYHLSFMVWLVTH